MWTTRHLLQACKNVSPLSLAQALPRVCSLWHPRVSEERRSCSSTTDVKAQDKILTVPNLLCVGRIFASPYLAFSIVEGELVKSLAIFCLAGFSDLLDGWIARKVPGQASKLGSFLDPLADKILVTTLYLSLTSASLMPASLTAMIVSRDVLLVYAGLYIRYMSVQPPFSVKKYFDVRLPTAQVNPTFISKINTGMQFLTITAALGFPICGYPNHINFFVLCGLTATTTFASALSYAFQRDTYTFAHRAYDHQTSKKLTALAIFILFNLTFTYWSYCSNQQSPNPDPVDTTAKE